MKDIVVIQSLQKRGANLSNLQEVLAYEAVERKPRHLDKAPSKITFTKVSDIQEYGCCSEFIICFNELKDNLKEDLCYVDMKGVKRLCDPDVFLTLQTLIQQSITCTEERASACFDLFRIIMMLPVEVLTAKAVYEKLASYKASNYYAKELLTAISICLFGNSVHVAYFANLCEYSGFYLKAIELGKEVISKECSNEKEVDAFLKVNYALAKEDKDFMQQIYKPGANKYLIAMIYYLKDKHPEVMNTGNTEGGFV